MACYSRQSEQSVQRCGSHSTAICSSTETHYEHKTGNRVRHYIPPGALSSYAQAKRCLHACGLDAPLLPPQRFFDVGKTPDKKSTSSLSANSGISSSATTSVQDGSCKPKMVVERTLFPCKTIATLFSHRKHRLALQAHCATFKQQLTRQNSQSKLLELPDHLLVKIICNLRHDETSPLAKVCGELRQAVNEAIEFHFAYSTPAAHTGAQQPGAPRPSKRLRVDNAEKLPPDRTSPVPMTAQITRKAAPRALHFSCAKPSNGTSACSKPAMSEGSSRSLISSLDKLEQT